MEHLVEYAEHRFPYLWNGSRSARQIHDPFALRLYLKETFLEIEIKEIGAHNAIIVKKMHFCLNKNRSVDLTD